MCYALALMLSDKAEPDKSLAARGVLSLLISTTNSFALATSFKNFLMFLVLTSCNFCSYTTACSVDNPLATF